MEELRKEFEKKLAEQGRRIWWTDLIIPKEIMDYVEFLEQKLSKQVTKEQLNEFVDNCFKAELTSIETIAVMVVKEKIFSHYILIPKEQ